jgi:hypothetical protein
MSALKQLFKIRCNHEWTLYGLPVYHAECKKCGLIIPYVVNTDGYIDGNPVIITFAWKPPLSLIKALHNTGHSFCISEHCQRKAPDA